MMKVGFIHRQRTQFPVDRMCQLLDVSRSHYYAKVSAQQEAEAPLEQEVIAIFRAHARRYGSRRIVAELRARGWSVGRQRVSSILSKHGLCAIQPKSFVPRTTQSPAGMKRSANLLLGRKPPTAPDQVWVGDITYLPLEAGGWCYLATWLDVFSRRIVGWSVKDHMRESLVIEAFSVAVSRRCPAAGLIVHSDGGGQYASKAFRKRLGTRYRQSMTRPDNHYDNAHAESLFSRFKAELLEGGAFLSLEDAHTECFGYIEEYYNRQRRHSSLGYMSPQAFESGYYARLSEDKP